MHVQRLLWPLVIYERSNDWTIDEGVHQFWQLQLEAMLESGYSIWPYDSWDQSPGQAIGLSDVHVALALAFGLCVAKPLYITCNLHHPGKLVKSKELKGGGSFSFTRFDKFDSDRIIRRPQDKELAKQQ